MLSVISARVHVYEVPAPTMMDVTEKYKGKGFTITGVRPPRPTAHVYEIRPRKDRRGFDLISDALPFGRLWYTEIPQAIGYAQFYSRSHHVVIRVYDDAGNVMETHEHTGDFREW